MLRATAIAGVLAIAAGHALANPAALVPSAGDEGDPADLNLHIDYEYSVESSTIYREAVGQTTDPLAPLPKTKDLTFHQYRHTITPRAEVGIYTNAWISFGIPIVIAQDRELEFADGDRDGSSSVRDGILPREGYDARDPGTAPPGNLAFRGIKRTGIDQLHMGLGVAPMNQLTDDTKPTWKLGGELLLSGGRVMRFNRLEPGAETGVGRGVHELKFWTTVDKRTKYVEGWFEMFWKFPVSAKQNVSLYDDPPAFGATNLMPGHVAGASAGLELIGVDDKLTKNRISLDLGGRVVGHFEGRDYTELWEVYAYAGDSRVSGPLQYDNDPINPGFQAQSHPGISNHENYLETAGRAAVSAQLGDHVQFSAVVDLVWKTDHLISFTDAGVDRPTCGKGQSPCEDDDNVVVNPNTNEVNPLHVPLIDLVGHRYISEDNFDFVLGVEARILY